MAKTCPKCDKAKALEEFFTARAKKSADRAERGRRKDSLWKTAKRIGKYDSKYLHEWYTVQFEKQGGKCAICGIHQVEVGKALSIDHDHDTKELRGLLCDSCNIGIGYLKHDAEACLKAYNYLRTSKIRIRKID